MPRAATRARAYRPSTPPSRGATALCSHLPQSCSKSTPMCRVRTRRSRTCAAPRPRRRRKSEPMRARRCAPRTPRCDGQRQHEVAGHWDDQVPHATICTDTPAGCRLNSCRQNAAARCQREQRVAPRLSAGRSGWHRQARLRPRVGITRNANKQAHILQAHILQSRCSFTRKGIR